MNELVVDAPEGFRYVLAHELPEAAAHPEHRPLNPVPVANVINRAITRHIVFHKCIYRPTRESRDKTVVHVLLVSELRRSHASVRIIDGRALLGYTRCIDMQFNW